MTVTDRPAGSSHRGAQRERRCCVAESGHAL